MLGPEITLWPRTAGLKKKQPDLQAKALLLFFMDFGITYKGCKTGIIPQL